jgi:hypothetical protein
MSAAYMRGHDHAESIEISSAEVPPVDERAPYGEPDPMEWQRGYDDYRARSVALMATLIEQDGDMATYQIGTARLTINTRALALSGSTVDRFIAQWVESE